MRLFDPQRPKDPMPQLMVDGRPVGMVPYIYVMPINDHECQLSAMIQTDTNNASHFTKIAETEFLNDLFSDFIGDPEGFCIGVLGWKWLGTTKKQDVTFDQLFGDTP